MRTLKGSRRDMSLASERITIDSTAFGVVFGAMQLFSVDIPFREAENVGNLRRIPMPIQKRIKPGETVGLKLTDAQRKLILDGLPCLPDDFGEAIRDTPTNQPVEFTLDGWEELAGHVAAESNHAEDTKVQKRLDTIFGKIEKLLDA